MDGATLQARVYAGYAKAALRVGLPYTIYRPTVATSPAIAIGNVIATIAAAFTVHSGGNYSFNRPSDYEKPTFHALLDGSQIQVGDYLASTGKPGPFFIASKDPLVPILAVSCNRTISIATPGPAGFTPGPSTGYAGTVGTALASNEPKFLTSWPASVLQGARSVSNKLLPGDVGSGMWAVLFPALAGVSVSSGDIISDDLGQRYTVRTAENTALGWRLSAESAQT